MTTINAYSKVNKQPIDQKFDKNSRVGKWAFQSYSISIYHDTNKLSAVLKDRKGNKYAFEDAEIEVGVLGNMPHAEYIEKLNKLSNENIHKSFVATPYSRNGEISKILFFEANKITIPQIGKAKENLEKATKEENRKSKWYQEALKYFEFAFKLDSEHRSTELENA